MISVLSVPFEDPRSRGLWDAQQEEIAQIYGEPDEHPDLDPEGLIASLLAVNAEGEPAGTVVARWSHYHPDAPGTAEVKRLFVAPEHRRAGYARVLMGALERACLKAGATRIVLETGALQPESIALYRAVGYTDIDEFGPYAGGGLTVCLGKNLPTRVLVINGTMGAGKTTTAAAVHDVLTAGGARTAFIDADYLCQADPPPPGDHFNQSILFDNLAAVAPVYRRHGYGLITIARVVEDPEDRERYARAFAGQGGLAAVTIVRVTAEENTRLARIDAREPEGYWRDMGRARTVELEAVLDELDLDDALVTTDRTARLDVARQVLRAAGWWVADAEAIV